MRSYDYAPRPPVESHYHIEELIRLQEKRASDRMYHQERKKVDEERDAEISEAKLKEVKPFYCSSCRKDFVSETVRQIETDWNNTRQRIAFYKSKCMCGKWAMRLITDKWQDSYWYRSQVVARDRGEHHNDMVQSFETGFNLLYGKV